MPDYNPDKERHVDHKFIVQKAYTFGEETKKGIWHDDKYYKFDKYGRFSLKNETVAREIQTRFPKECTVTRMRYPHISDRGHKYHFSVPELPWKRGKDATEDN